MELNTDDLERVLEDGLQPVEPQAQVSPFIGPYQLLGRIGHGGAAQVYRARHIHPSYSDRTFAVKVVHANLEAREKVLALFKREAYLLSLLSHPNVVATFEAGVAEDHPFIAMEYVEGRDLFSFLANCRTLEIRPPVPVMLYLVSEVLSGLSSAHELRDADDRHLGLVHRDIKPHNIFMSFSGDVKLGDFGIAALFDEGESKELLGTLGYFAPEQLEGSGSDQRSDLFAVGAITFELLCGERLFDADDMRLAFRRNQKARIPNPLKLNPDLPRELADVVLKSLARDPEQRFASAAEMRDAIAPWVPQTAGMRLAMASLMRTAFDDALMEESKLRRDLAGSRGDLHAEVVALLGEERVLDNIREHLLHAGHSVESHAEMASLRESSDAALPPRVAMVDVTRADLTPRDLHAALADLATPTPVIAVAAGLDPASIEVSHRLGALDILVPPFQYNRVCAAAYAALATSMGRPEPDAGAAENRVGPKLLLVGGLEPRITELAEDLVRFGFRVEVCADLDAAIEATDRASYAAYVLPTTLVTEGDAVERIRARPGMGATPALFLSEDGHNPDRSARTAARALSDEPGIVASTIEQLISDFSAGRSFKRYPCDIPVELRYAGGRVAGRLLNVSRGGFSIECDRLVPLHARANVEVHPNSGLNVEAVVRVVRVDSPDATTGHSRVGVEAVQFGRRTEANLIQLIRDLEQTAAQA